MGSNPYGALPNLSVPNELLQHIELYPHSDLVFSVILLGEIFSTAAPMLWISANKLGQEGSMRHRIVVLVLGAIAFVGGQLPFGQLVGIVYPYTGYMGILLLIIIAVKTYFIDPKNETKTV